MRQTRIRFWMTVLTLFGVLAWIGVAGAEEPEKGKKARTATLEKTTGNPIYAVLNINNLSSWMRHDGVSNFSAHGEGLIYPRFTAGVIYKDGVVWGGKMYLNAAKTQPAPKQLVRAGGSTYGWGTQAGRVVGFGATAVAADRNAPEVRIYRIRRDYMSMSTDELRKDAANTNEVNVSDVTDAQMAAVRNQYDKDWKEWPVSLGAPYVDRNKNGKYDPPSAFSSTFTVDSLVSQNRDEPGIAGADPNSPGDQVIWTVFNDLNPSLTQGFLNSEPVGIEAQVTIWGYKRSDALGNLYFKKVKLINKGGVDIGGDQKGTFYIDSMYVCQWSDPDLGNAGDDLAGCDTTLNIGYIYNGNPVDITFRVFSLPPPSAAYDFLQGPIIPSPGDSAIFDLKVRKGFKNLGMTSFAYFSAGSPYSDPPNRLPGSYSVTTGQWWKMLRGFAPIGDLAGADIPYERGPWPPSKFPLSGDPVAKRGFTDGAGRDYSFIPGDRRILLNTGPFTMAPGDTQEIVVGTVVGLGADRLSSVAVMKFNDRFVQNTYDALFQVPKAPKAPNVKVAELNGQIVLEWGSDVQNVADTETKIGQPGSFKFEGYNLYQFPSAQTRLSEAKRIVTYDLENEHTVVLDETFDQVSGQVLRLPVQFGPNTGIQRYFNFRRDYLLDQDKIFNGQEYYLAVTAYGVSSIAGYLPYVLESDPQVLTVRPKIPFGKVLMTKFGDTLTATKSGTSDGSVLPRVFDPSSSTGHTYEIRFDTTGGKDTWRMSDKTLNRTLLTGQTNQTGDDLSPIVDGIMVKVFGAPNDAKDFQHVQNPAGKITPPTYVGFSTFNSAGFPDPDPSRGGAAVADFGDGGRWGVHTGGSSTDFTYEGRFKPRTFRNDNFTRFVPYDFEIRFTAAGGKAYLAFSSGAVIDVPFELWNIGMGTPDNPADDFRMIPWINDEDGSGKFQLQKLDHQISGGDNDPYTSWIYWMDPDPKTPGSAGYNAFVAAGAAYDGSQGTGSEVMARMVLVNINGGSISAANWPANANSQMPKTGNVIRIFSTKPNNPSVTFTFTAPAPDESLERKKESAKRAGVYPNPYYTSNPAETNRFDRFVTFNNLPPKATIRIFTLSGQLIRVLEKDDPSQFLRWNLANRDNFPVASGMYIAYVDMPDIGVTQVLKLGILQEQEIFDVY